MAKDLLTAQTATGAGRARNLNGAHHTFQAVGRTTAGAGSATIDIEVSNDGTNWLQAGTITLTLSTTDSNDGFMMFASWPFARANVTAISGTGASVDATVAA